MPGAGLDADGEGVRRWDIERVEVDLGHTPVKTDGLVGHRQRHSDADMRGDHAELACGYDGARLAAAVDGVQRRSLRGRAHGDAEVDVAQVARRSGELEL